MKKTASRKPATRKARASAGKSAQPRKRRASPRRGAKGMIFTNASPELFEDSLRAVVESVQHKPFDDRLVFLNAWNEWAEGNHLEPDLKFGRGFLDAAQRVADGRHTPSISSSACK